MHIKPTASVKSSRNSDQHQVLMKCDKTTIVISVVQQYSSD